MPIQSRGYVCGYCSHRVGPNTGFSAGGQAQVFIYICSYCTRPTYFGSDGKQYPGVPLAVPVENVPKEIGSLYAEARQCASVGSHTSAVLTCRKILMHIAVQKGAKAGDSFVSYVEYLASKGYAPPDAKTWVDYIRQKGNEANHEIKVMSEQDAQPLIAFVEMLLKLIYEFPQKVPSVAPSQLPQTS